MLSCFCALLARLNFDFWRSMSQSYINFQSVIPLSNLKRSKLLLSLLFVILSYVAVSLPQEALVKAGVNPFVLSIGQMIGFVGFALVALIILGGRKAFRDLAPKPKARQIPLIFFYALLSMFLAIGLAQFVSNLQANPIIDIAAASPLFMVLTALLLVFQLFFEELVAVLSFVLVYQLLAQRGLSHKACLLLALIFSVLLAAAVHIPTYNFNVVQSLLVIGGARLGLGIAYAHSKNFWIAYLAHLLYDGVLIALALIAILGFGVSV